MERRKDFIQVRAIRIINNIIIENRLSLISYREKQVEKDGIK